MQLSSCPIVLNNALFYFYNVVKKNLTQCFFEIQPFVGTGVNSFKDMQIEPIQKKSVVQDAISKIKELIDQGYLHFGERLAPERELARLLGISLPSLREALRALSILGIVEMRPGNGTYLRSSLDSWSSDPFSLLFDLRKPLHIDLFEARRGIEGIMAELAAEKRSDEDLKAMGLALEKMKSNVEDKGQYMKAEIEFHQAVIRAAKNAILEDFMKKMYKLLYESRRKTITFYKDLYKESYLKHYRIYSSIKNRDVKGAKKNMLKHLVFLEERVKEDNGKDNVSGKDCDLKGSRRH